MYFSDKHEVQLKSSVLHSILNSSCLFSIGVPCFLCFLRFFDLQALLWMIQQINYHGAQRTFIHCVALLLLKHVVENVNSYARQPWSFVWLYVCAPITRSETFLLDSINEPKGCNSVSRAPEFMLLQQSATVFPKAKAAGKLKADYTFSENHNSPANKQWISWQEASQWVSILCVFVSGTEKWPHF